METTVENFISAFNGKEVETKTVLAIYENLTVDDLESMYDTFLGIASKYQARLAIYSAVNDFHVVFHSTIFPDQIISALNGYVSIRI